MSLRARMHPRNIYRTPPNFKELAVEYPEFRKYIKQELSGRVTLDYSDRKALMELTKILLLKDFNLRVEINEARLIPRVPLCLNYVLWIEDLLEALNKKTIQGIDIGTGSVCIYSLLASTKGWNMLATEIDKISYETACENVKTNCLSDKITLKFVEDSNQILCSVIDDGLTYDFCMCNPPFYDDNEKPVNRTKKRKMIEVVSSYVDTDIITQGGEVKFIRKLINESKILKDRVKIYTTLVGRKSDFMVLKKDVLNISPASVTYTEFCQGNTTRWGIAWSFSKLNFSERNDKLSNSKRSKTKVLQFVVPQVDCSMVDISHKVIKILDHLKISYHMQEVSDSKVFTLRAFENTWSHQRRKNRLKKREEEASNIQNETKKNNNLEEAAELDSQGVQDNSVCGKKIKLAENVNTVHKSILAECLLILKKEFEVTAVEISWLSGNKESVHQIFQYLKNNFEKKYGNVDDKINE